MSRITFENYGNYAKTQLSYVQIAGRYSIQEMAEKNIVLDVVNKLNLTSSDELLEIGCGSGTLLIPLSFFVSKAVGIDHPNLLEKLNARFKDESIHRIPGNFLDLEINQTFSKILIYGVLQCLANEQEVIQFLQKAVRLLKPQGRLLIGDLPNTDKKQRFLLSKRGQDFSRHWRETFPENDLQQWQATDLQDPHLVEFNDEIIMKILLFFRKHGFESYVVSQPNNLPFCFSREDILIEKLE